MAITVQEMAAQLQRAGYPGPFDPASVQAAYMRTATQADLVANGLIAAPRPAPSTSTAPSVSPQGFNSAAAQQAVALANNAAQMAYNNAKLQQVDIPGQRLQQDQLAFDKAKEAWSEAFQQAQANIKNPLDIAGITGTYNGQPTLAAQGQQSDTALRYLTLLSGLRGPNDPFQYLRTLAGTPRGLTDIVNAAAGRYQLGTAPSGEQSAQASIAGQLGNLAMVQGAGGVPGAGGVGGAGVPAGVAGGAAPAAPANMAQAVAAAMPNYGSSSAPVFNPPGPNSPNDTAQGTLMGGTTGMFQGATQNFGIGPGQGSNSISGTRGTNMVGYDPATGQLQFDSQFLQPKSKVVYNLFDQTTGQNVADNSAVMGAVKGTGSGWSGAYYVPGGNGRYTFQGVTPNIIDPSHMYRIRIALPDEGGGVGDAMERDVPGSAILSLPNHNATAQQQQTAQQPAQPAIDPNFMPADTPYKQALVAQNPALAQAGYRDMLKRTRGYVWSPDENAPTPAATAPGTDPLSQVQSVLSGLPLPGQINAQAFNAMDPSQRGALWGAYEFGGPTGAMRPEDAQFAFQNSLPKYQGPTGGSVNLKV